MGKVNKNTIIIASIIVLLLIFIGILQAKDYIPHDNEFVRVGNTNISYSLPSAIELQNGRVLVFGGSFSKENKKYELKAEIYDSKTRKFSPTGDLNVYHGYSDGVYAKKYYTTTLLKDGRVLITGGQTIKELSNGFPRYSFPAISTAEIYNPQSGKFIKINDMNSPRLNHTANLLPNGKVLIFGGLFTPTAELFDPKTNTFSLIDKPHVYRIGFTAVSLTNGNVLIIGGQNQREKNYDESPPPEIYDYKLNKFIILKKSTPALNVPKVIQISHDKFVIFNEVNEIATYNYKTEEYKTVYRFPVQLSSGYPFLLDKKNTILMVGGRLGYGQAEKPIKNARFVDPETFKITEDPKIKFPFFGTMLLLKNGDLLVIGKDKQAGIVLGINDNR